MLQTSSQLAFAVQNHIMMVQALMRNTQSKPHTCTGAPDCDIQSVKGMWLQRAYALANVITSHRRSFCKIWLHQTPNISVTSQFSFSLSRLADCAHGGSKRLEEGI